MDAFETITGRAYPLGLKNVDTDVIISAEWLKTIKRAGLGLGAFAVLREEPGNVFDDLAYQGAPILIAGDNFGCGSSREHAAWAIADLGIRVVIAPSFSDIFSGNAFKNGILTVVLDQSAVDILLKRASDGMLTVDLGHQTVTTLHQERFDFEIDAFRKTCLLGGLDEIGITLESSDEIALYEADIVARSPWLIPAGPPASVR